MLCYVNMSYVVGGGFGWLLGDLWCVPQTQAMKDSNNTEPQISVRRLSCMFTPLFEYFSVLCGEKGRNMVKDSFSGFFPPQ